VYGLEQMMVRLPVLCRGKSEDWNDGRIAQVGRPWTSASPPALLGTEREAERQALDYDLEVGEGSSSI